MTLTDRITARLKAELGDFTSPAKCERIIKIVLEGIRERTEAMFDAGYNAMSDLSFRLGEAWPDWWAEKHARNEVTTHNNDRRWRGGPDYALLHTPRGVVHKFFGDLISPEDFV